MYLRVLSKRNRRRYPQRWMDIVSTISTAHHLVRLLVFSLRARFFVGTARIFSSVQFCVEPQTGIFPLIQTIFSPAKLILQVSGLVLCILFVGYLWVGASASRREQEDSCRVKETALCCQRRPDRGRLRTTAGRTAVT